MRTHRWPYGPCSLMEPWMNDLKKLIDSYNFKQFKHQQYKHLGASIVPNRSKQTHKIASGFTTQWHEEIVIIIVTIIIILQYKILSILFMCTRRCPLFGSGRQFAWQSSSRPSTWTGPGFLYTGRGAACNYAENPVRLSTILFISLTQIMQQTLIWNGKKLWIYNECKSNNFDLWYWEFQMSICYATSF